MDLTRRGLLLLVAVVAAAQAAGCGSETPLEFGSEALILPATLGEALPLAISLARAEEDGAVLTRVGGGFSVMDEHGRGPNHTFVFHARVGQATHRRITVHLFHGSPWVESITIGSLPPPPLDESDLMLDSDDLVERAIQLAPLHGVALSPAYAARLSSIPAWPEPETTADVGTERAWRVDFLVLTPLGNTTVYFSTARFYFDLIDADLLGPPEVPSSPELYPFP